MNEDTRWKTSLTSQLPRVKNCYWLMVMMMAAMQMMMLMKLMMMLMVYKMLTLLYCSTQGSIGSYPVKISRYCPIHSRYPTRFLRIHKHRRCMSKSTVWNHYLMTMPILSRISCLLAVLLDHLKPSWVSANFSGFNFSQFIPSQFRPMFWTSLSQANFSRVGFSQLFPAQHFW